MQHEDVDFEGFERIGELSDPCWAALRAATGGAADRARAAAEKVFQMDLAFQTGREMRTARGYVPERRFVRKLWDLGLFVLRYLSCFYLAAVSWFGWAYEPDAYGHALRVAAALAALSLAISLHAVFAAPARARLCFAPRHGGPTLALRALLHVQSAPPLLRLARAEPRLGAFLLALLGELLFGGALALARAARAPSQDEWVSAWGLFLLVPPLDLGRALLTPEAAEALERTVAFTGSHFALSPRATRLDVSSATFVQDTDPEAIPVRRVAGARLGYSLVRVREPAEGRRVLKYIDFLFYLVFPLTPEEGPGAGADAGRGPAPSPDPESPLLGDRFVSPRAHNAAIALVPGPARPLALPWRPARGPPRPAARLHFSAADGAALEAVLAAVERAAGEAAVREQCGAVRAFVRAVGELDAAVAAATEGDGERRRDLRDVRVSALTLTLDRERVARRAIPPLPAPHAAVL